MRLDSSCIGLEICVLHTSSFGNFRWNLHCLISKFSSEITGLGALNDVFMNKMRRVNFVGSLLLVMALTGILTAASVGGREIAYNPKTFIALSLISILLIVALQSGRMRVLPSQFCP